MSSHRMRNLLLVLTILVPAMTADAAKPHEERRELEQQVAKAAKILRAESMGSKIDRREYFEPLLSGETVAEEVYWQAGYVKQDERWVPYDGIAFTTETQAALKEYAEYRAKFWGNDEEHLQIAQWCAEKGLHEQARAHLMAVLLNHSGNDQLRQALGYQRVAGEWMTASEYSSVESEYQRLAEKLRKWGPEIAQIRDGIASGIPLKSQQAFSALSKIKDADAVPALDMILLPHSELCAQKCVEQLALIPHRGATLSLCRTVLSCPWRNVSEMALVELKLRPQDDYIPAMLAGTRKNHSVDLKLYWDDPLLSARGFLTIASLQTSAEGFAQIDHRVHQHGLQFFTLFEIQKWNAIIPDVFANASTFSGLSWLHQHSINSLAGGDEVVNFKISVLDLTYEKLKSLEQQEIEDREFNDRVVMLVSRVVPDRDFESIDSVWDWWNSSRDLGINRSRLANDSQVIEVAEDSFTFTVKIASCFTAGTPVWSEFGSRPIESLKIGDRVLTKHVETGELTYRPVIRTTYRVPDRGLIRLSLENDAITATSGHLFWVSGSGWIKARDLKPGHRIHTPTGTVEVTGIEEVAAEPVYNLVVDGFHTYFVGEHKVLCHDTTLISPTDALVPGLVD